MNEIIQRYYSLTKPGVTYGNALTAVAGYLFGAGEDLRFLTFVALALGITLVIASACVINNYYDQDIDRLMERTKQRALVAGTVSSTGAVIFSITLGVLGALLLWYGTNILTLWVALFGWFTYVYLYGRLSKRLSIHGTLVGSVSGAAPILAGYTAAVNQIDIAGVLLFAVLFFWQMPEFYSIAIYRLKEYKKAGVPVMSVVKGVKSTRIQILIYTALFVASTLLLTPYGDAGIVYFVTMSLSGAYWLVLAVKGQRAADIDAWAKRMFRFSLVILLIFCGVISVAPFLP